MKACGYLRAAVACALAVAVTGCGLAEAPMIDPAGPQALAERDLLFTALGLMLIVVIPVFLMTFLFVLRYRSSNRKAKYAPEWSYSGPIDAVIWIVPALIVIALGILLWNATHALDPYKQLHTQEEALEVRVVAQDWKWLFIYPEQDIASVNELAFPSDRPLSLRITSDTVMNSFHVPALAGQIYAMAGMQTRLNLLADEPGTFMGRNVQYSGDGFSGQHFTAVAKTQEDFEAWVDQAQNSSNPLDAEAYKSLAEPSSDHPVTYYSGVESDLFRNIIAKYAAHPANSHHDPR
ncbi:ubiquinol oxidase subunit II [Fodinicurvata halophila]|uniref:Ubiquinol oxidase subunit 2 n=1 Tax=Fodinicurvata halophila TaxID=1419723 RepID=A0ABV8ULL6_9PROT